MGTDLLRLCFIEEKKKMKRKMCASLKLNKWFKTF